MRRMAKGIVVLASTALAFSLAACGGEDKAADEKPKTDPAALKAELTWWDTSDPKNEGPAFQELVAKFNEKYPNVKINYQSVQFG
ncbi:MAG TPA: sugar ABC transporter substrate-binding protein, partial [Micromonosporaceae bacterium]